MMEHDRRGELTELGAALLVIDMQEALLEVAHKRGEVLKKISVLLERARSAAAPVFYTQHDHAYYEPMMPGSSGWCLHQEIAPLENETVVRKRSADPFYETDLEAKLRSRKVERVVIVGIATEYYVDSTQSRRHLAWLRRNAGGECAYHCTGA